MATGKERFEKIASHIVGTVFALGAAGLLWVLWSMYANHYAARSWLPVPAEVTSARERTSRSGNAGSSSINSRIEAAYRYRFNGVEYEGARVDFSFGSDNFSGTRRGRQMQMLQGDVPVLAYVNPRNPAESVLDRSLPMEQVNFAVVFFFFPCGVGTAMVLGWLTHFISLAGWEGPSRFFLPMMGMVHSLPAFYAPLFATAELGFFGWLLVLVASVTLLASMRSAWRRFRDPTIGAPRWTGRYGGSQ